MHSQILALSGKLNTPRCCPRLQKPTMTLSATFSFSISILTSFSWSAVGCAGGAGGTGGTGGTGGDELSMIIVIMVFI